MAQCEKRSVRQADRLPLVSGQSGGARGATLCTWEVSSHVLCPFLSDRKSLRTNIRARGDELLDGLDSAWWYGHRCRDL
jgi:hypothetical protein